MFLKFIFNFLSKALLDGKAFSKTALFGSLYIKAILLRLKTDEK
jgi:hypothetical protein